MKKTLIFICFLFSSVLLNAQTTFQKTIGGSSDDLGNCVQKTSDGGYIIVGATSSFGSGLKDLYLIKIGYDGDTLWTKTYGEVSGVDEVGLFVQQTTDGGYIVSGYTNNAGLDGYLIKTFSNGNIDWAKIFHDSGGSSSSNCVQQTSDGGYVIVGFGPEEFSVSMKDISVIKINATGTILWSKYYGGGNNDFGNCIQQTTDGGYIITGSTLSFGAGNSDVCLLKLDSLGALQWSKTYGGTNNDFGNSVQQTKDGGFIITGSTQSYGSGGSDIYLIKTDSNGAELWANAYGTTSGDFSYSVRQTFDKGYIISGSTYHFGVTLYDAYLIKTDSMGSEVWSNTFGVLGQNEYGYSVEQTNDSCYIILGNAGGINNDIYLIKTDKNGNSGCNESDPLTITNAVVGSVFSSTTNTNLASISAINAYPIIGRGGITTTLCYSTGINESHIDNETLNIYPNPATNQITMEFDLAETKNTFIEIKNLLGQTVENITNTAFSKGANKIEIEINEFSKGLYFIQLQSGNKIINKKFVKQ